jgi:uncharacterized protein (TIGR02466 family)
MTDIQSLFATHLYRTQLDPRINAELEKAALVLAQQDVAGIQWCRDNHYKGYTSYSSIGDLPRRAQVFADLIGMIEPHVLAFAQSEFEIGSYRPVLDGIWVNIMETGATHAPHFHPHSIVSGTYYVTAPQGAGGIAFEDPRLGLMMAAPPRRASGPASQQSFVSVKPVPGLLLLWESWLRHGVEPNRALTSRTSVSFNYR